SVALTGTEAITNGVPAFKRPEPKNAATTLTAMAILLGILFVGVTFIADRFGIVAVDEPTTRTVILSAVAIGLLVLFGGNTTALIPLYSVGVFVSFTISQSGMVLHWLHERKAGWRWRIGINGLGAVLTGLVTIVVLIGKAPTSLLVALIIPVLVGMMLFINRHYRASAESLAVRTEGILPAPRRRERAIVPVPGIDRAVVQAVNVARSMAEDVRAVVVSETPAEAMDLRAEWDERVPDVPLDIVESPYLALAAPMVA